MTPVKQMLASRKVQLHETCWSSKFERWLMLCRRIRGSWLRADALKEADASFQKKFNSPNTSQAVLKALCWERVEYNTLLQQAQAFRTTIESLLPHLQPGSVRVQDVAHSLKDLKEDLKKYLRNVFVKKRQPAATHVLAILVSEERRNKKPYSIPVQFVPYTSIKDQYIRDITTKVKREMVKMDLKPVGRLLSIRLCG